MGFNKRKWRTGAGKTMLSPTIGAAIFTCECTECGHLEVMATPAAE